MGGSAGKGSRVAIFVKFLQPYSFLRTWTWFASIVDRKPASNGVSFGNVGEGMTEAQNRLRISRRAFLGVMRPRVWIRVAVVSSALAGLLVPRSGPLRLLALSSGHSAVTHLSHDQRPRFDNTGSQWSIPIASFVGTPPVAIHAGVSLATALDEPLRTEGAHYNRPPPCS